MSKRKNVVLLIADSLRYDSVFSAARKNGYLPHLYQNSYVYRNAFSTGCWTLPATASILLANCLMSTALQLELE